MLKLLRRVAAKSLAELFKAVYLLVLHLLVLRLNPIKLKTVISMSFSLKRSMFEQDSFPH